MVEWCQVYVAGGEVRGRGVGLLERGWLGQRRGLKAPKPHILLWAPEQSSEAGIGSWWFCVICDSSHCFPSLGISQPYHPLIIDWLWDAIFPEMLVPGTHLGSLLVSGSWLVFGKGWVVWWWEEAESLELNGPGLEFLIYHLIVVWPWKSHLTSLSLSFFTSKWGWW